MPVIKIKTSFVVSESSAHSHPFAPHEDAFQGLIRLQNPGSLKTKEAFDQAVQAAYDAAVVAATGFCRRVNLGPAEERGMEAVHELFCQLRPHAAKHYNTDLPLFPYVHTALKYIVFGMARQEKKARGRVQANEPVAGQCDPAYAAELAELKELVERLPEGLRNTVLLRYFSGHTSKEAAAILNTTVNAVDVRLHRARSALGAMLE